MKAPLFCLKLWRRKREKGSFFLAPLKMRRFLSAQKYAVIINVECPDMNINCVEAAFKHCLLPLQEPIFQELKIWIFVLQERMVMMMIPIKSKWRWRTSITIPTTYRGLWRALSKAVRVTNPITMRHPLALSEIHQAHSLYLLPQVIKLQSFEVFSSLSLSSSWNWIFRQ